VENYFQTDYPSSQWPSACPTVVVPCYNNINRGILKRSSTELIHQTVQSLMVFIFLSIPPHLWHSHPLFLIEWLWLHSQCCFLCSNQKCSCPLPYSGNKSKTSSVLLHNTKATCTIIRSTFATDISVLSLDWNRHLILHKQNNMVFSQVNRQKILLPRKQRLFLTILCQDKSQHTPVNWHEKSIKLASIKHVEALV